MAERILIVDDDPVHRRLIENMVTRFGYGALTVDGGEAALAALSATDGLPFDAVILDLMMPGLHGLGVLARMREAGLGMPVIVQTAHGGIDNVVSAMRAGAVDFAVKPVGAERLHVSLRNALATRALESELKLIKRSRTGTLDFSDIVSRSPRMQATLRIAEKAATSTIPVLIEGESGVGKELISRAIHGAGERRAKPFVAVNCGAIPDNLVESILFGHERGAFTGATERHTGKFVEASGGTLFLDEVGELPLAAQVKLLRAIQEGEVEPVGARKPVKVDVRIISATHRNLTEDVAAGRFREDLFYRLHVFPLAVPPLRDRPEDIPDLLRHFLARFAAEEGRRIRAVSGEAVRLLRAFAWPGNVRQLENAVFRAVVLADTDELTLAEFPQIAAASPALTAVAETELSPVSLQGEFAADPDDFALNQTMLMSVIESRIDDSGSGGSPLAASAHSTLARMNPNGPPHDTPVGQPVSAVDRLSLLDAAGEVRALDDIESEVIRFAISHYRGQMSEVARKLRIGRSTLYRKLEGLGLDEPERGGLPAVAGR